MKAKLSFFRNLALLAVLAVAAWSCTALTDDNPAPTRSGPRTGFVSGSGLLSAGSIVNSGDHKFLYRVVQGTGVVQRVDLSVCAVLGSSCPYEVNYRNTDGLSSRQLSDTAEVRIWTPGRYLVKVKARDANGLGDSTSFNFTVN